MRELELESSDGVGDSARFYWTTGGKLYVHLDNPWAGDTETGFGASCSYKLTRAQAVRLRDWLVEGLGQDSGGYDRG